MTLDIVSLLNLIPGAEVGAFDRRYPSGIQLRPRPGSQVEGVDVVTVQSDPYTQPF